MSGEGCPEGTVLEVSPKRVSSPNPPSSCSAYDCNTPGLASFCKLVMRTESLSGLCISYSCFRVLNCWPSAPLPCGTFILEPGEGAGLAEHALRAQSQAAGVSASAFLFSALADCEHSAFSSARSFWVPCASWRCSPGRSHLQAWVCGSWAEGRTEGRVCAPLRPAGVLVQGRVTRPSRGFWPDFGASAWMRHFSLLFQVRWGQQGKWSPVGGGTYILSPRTLSSTFLGAGWKHIILYARAVNN